MSEFERDRDAALADVEAAREEFVGRVRALRDADLTVGRRGSWTVAGVLQHVIDADWYHGKGIASLRDEDPPRRESTEDGADGAGPASVVQALASLAASGAALRATVAGVDEESFYRLRPVGGQDWSVLSFLEGTADHDREHASQIAALLGR